MTSLLCRIADCLEWLLGRIDVLINRRVKNGR